MMENIESVTMNSINRINSDVIFEVNNKVDIKAHDNAVHTSYLLIRNTIQGELARSVTRSIRNAFK